VDSKLTPESIPAEEVERYYRAHPEEFDRPEAVRVSEIVTRQRARAQKAAAEARRVSDEKGFSELVAKYSEDADSRSRGGDLGFLDRKNGQWPAPLVEAAFALEKPGQISAPVAVGEAFHVLRLTARRPGFTRPLAGADREIRMRLLGDRRARRTAEIVEAVRKTAHVEIREAELAQVNAR
jgi:parvulin-like peptidyl-prolyl isomerase